METRNLPLQNVQKVCCKYWFYLIKHTPFIEPYQKDQTFMLMDHINHYSLLNLSIIHNQDLCLDTHSARKINLVHNYIASLNEVN